MKKLEDFMNRHPPNRRQSQLKPYENEIFRMYDLGYQVEQIQEWLAQNNINVSVRAINKFKQNLSKKNSSLKNPQKNQNQGQKQQEEVEHKATKAFFGNLDRYRTQKQGEET